MGDEDRGPAASWRRALAPGEHHGFWRNPGWYDAQAMHHEADDLDRLYTALIQAFPPLPPGSAVLDLGAGTGTLVARLARFYPHLRYVLLDGNAPALERAREKLAAAYPPLDATFVHETVVPEQPGSLPGAPYRLVTSSVALHDIVRPAPPDDATARAAHRARHVALLRRILASLEPGGHFVYADALRPGFRVAEHLATLSDAGFAEVDCAYAVGRLGVFGGQKR